MRVPTPDIVDYRVSRTLDDAYYPGATLDVPKAPITWLDWIAAFCSITGVGTTVYLVAHFLTDPTF